jgi:hypothetical protein
VLFTVACALHVVEPAALVAYWKLDCSLPALWPWYQTATARPDGVTAPRIGACGESVLDGLASGVIVHVAPPIGLVATLGFEPEVPSPVTMKT